MKIIIPTALQNIFKVIQTSFMIWKYALIKIIPISLIYLIIQSLLLSNFLDKLAKIDFDKFLNQFSLTVLFSGKYLLIAGQVMLSIIVFYVSNASIIYIINKAYNNVNVNISFTEVVMVGYNKAFVQLRISILNIVILSVVYLIFLFGFFKIIPTVFLTFKFVMYLVMILSFIPVGIIFVYFTFAIYQPIIAEDNIISSIKNSFNLILGDWWYMFWASLIIYLLVPYLDGLVLANFSIKDNLYVNFFLQNSLNTIFWGPLIHAFMITIFHDFKAKKSAKLHGNEIV